jgi:hypothetical protein
MLGLQGFSLLSGSAMLVALALCRPSSGLRIVLFTLAISVLAMAGLGATMKHLVGITG